MLQEYWASTVIFIGIFSQCGRVFEVAGHGFEVAIKKIKIEDSI